MFTNTAPSTVTSGDRNIAAANARGFLPEMKVLAGEHPVFDGRIKCETCEGSGGAASAMGPCPFCRGTGLVTHGEHRPPITSRYGDDDITAVTQAELAVVVVAA